MWNNSCLLVQRVPTLGASSSSAWAERSREAKSAAIQVKSSLTESVELFIGPPDLSSPDTTNVYARRRSTTSTLAISHDPASPLAGHHRKLTAKDHRHQGMGPMTLLAPGSTQ